MVFFKFIIPERFKPANNNLQTSPGKFLDEVRVTCCNVSTDIHDKGLLNSLFDDPVKK